MFVLKYNLDDSWEILSIVFSALELLSANAESKPTSASTFSDSIRDWSRNPPPFIGRLSLVMLRERPIDSTLFKPNAEVGIGAALGTGASALDSLLDLNCWADLASVASSPTCWSSAALLSAISKRRSKRSRSGLIKSDFSERCLLISLADANRVVESNAFSNALSWSKRKGSRYTERSRCKNQWSRKVGSFLFSR